jgi:tRNA(Ile)-lysidine synthase
MTEDASRKVYDEVITEEKEIRIDIHKLLKYPNYKAYLYEWLQSYGFSAWEDIYDLVQAQSGKTIFAPNHVLLKDRGFLLLYPSENIENQEIYFIEKGQTAVKVPLNLIFCKAENISNPSRNSIFADEEKLQAIRKIREDIMVKVESWVSSIVEKL